jgi:DNA-binding LacI/PurR family transcriptional regulator
MQPVAMTVSKANTIADIARIAGVDKSTVSRALNDSPLIASATKERIRTIAEQHDFELNVPAQRLSRRQGNVAGLVRFDWGKGFKTLDMFMLEIMGGISTELSQQGYELLVLQAKVDDPSWAHRYLESGRADGFILLSASCTPELLESLGGERLPIVVWGAPAANNDYSSVSGESFEGGRIATEHLLSTGRRRIAFLGGPTWAAEVEDRRRGYEAAHTAAGLAADPELTVHANWEQPEASAAAAIETLLERDPALDAVFANSDLFALGAIDALRAHGRRVPDDVGVMGYDDIAIAAYANPPLTTIRQDGLLVGTLLARTLVQRLETGAITNVTIPAELVVRGSA